MSQYLPLTNYVPLAYCIKCLHTAWLIQKIVEITCDRLAHIAGLD